MNERVLVTGGSGFVGSWVLRKVLDRGATPIVVDLEPAPERWRTIAGSDSERIVWSEASLLDPESLQKVMELHQVSRLIHLAALLTPDCQADPWKGCQVNILGSAAVFEAARNSDLVKSLSYASSYAVYGPEQGAENRPTSFYGAFKQAVDLLAEQYWRHFQIASLAIRPHVVYGPEREQGLTAGPSLAARAAAQREPFCIQYRGSVCYDYVEDVAEAFVRAAFECPLGATVVDMPGEMATCEQFADAIMQEVPESRISVDGPEIPDNIPPAPNYIQNIFTDWQPTTLREGVRRTVAFYRT